MALPSRPRDFRLTPEHAAALRPNAVRRFLAGAAAGFRVEFLRPLAGAAMAIGLLLVVVGSFPSLGVGSTGGAPTAEDATLQRVAAATAAAAAYDPTTPDRDSSPTNGFSGQVYPATVTAAPTMGASVPAKSGGTPAATSSGTESNPTDQSMAPQPVAAPSAGSAPVAPEATGEITAFVPAGTPGSDEPPSEAGGSGSAVQADLSQPAGTIPPLVILGVLLASVGLLVLVLSLAARRIGRDAV